MPNLGGAEILVILLVALLVLGPDKLPGAARSVGKGLSHLRRLSGGFEKEIRSAMGEADAANAQRSVTAAPASPGGGVHPGLGPGPRLGAGAVTLGGDAAQGDPPVASGSGAGGSAIAGGGGTGSTTGVTRPRVEGPDESFS